MGEHAFCENMNASALSPWHIRETTNSGPKFGGGADTKALCGEVVAWDLDVDLTPFHLARNACRVCAEAYGKLTPKDGGVA